MCETVQIAWELINFNYFLIEFLLDQFSINLSVIQGELDKNWFQIHICVSF